MEQMAFTLAAMLAVLVFGAGVVLIPPVWNAWLNEKPARVAHLVRRGWLGFIGDQVGGYVHDTGMTQWIPPTMMFGDTATWAIAAGSVTNSVVYGCDATDETANLFVPILLPSNSAAQKGAYLTSIEVDYDILVAACDTVTATIYKNVRGADGADVTVSAPAFSYDAAHDTDDERDDLDEHLMVLTLTTPAWVDEDDYYWLKIAFDKAGTSTVEILGVFANYTLRI